MKFTIDSTPPGPLKVLSELPDARLAILEGLNGIGKTLAVHILELCTGSLPYALDSAAWASLWRGLGTFEVHALGLQGGHEIKWRADSREWENGVAFHEITIDGRSASMPDVRRVLMVHRVAGDERLVDTLSHQADAGADAIRRWTRRYAHQTVGPLFRLEGVASESLKLLGPWSLEGYRTLAANAEDAHVRVAATTREAEDAEGRRNEVSTALSVKRQLEDLKIRSPGLAERIGEIDARIRVIESEREGVLADVQRLAGHVAVAGPWQRELLNARRTVERNRDNWSHALRAATVGAAELGVTLGKDPIEQLIRDLEALVAQVEREHTSLDAAPTMRSLLDQVTGELGSAERQGLGDEVAVDDPVSEVQLTVTQTRAGMTARRAYLEGKPPPPQAKEINERLEQSRRSLARARQLRYDLREAERCRRLVSQNEDRVNRALAAINPNAVAQMEVLESQRRSFDDELLHLAAERASISQQLGGVGDENSERALAMQLAAALKQLGMGEDELVRALDDAEAVVKRTQLSLSQAQEGSAALRRELARASVEIRRATGALRTDVRLGWVRRAASKTLEGGDGDTPQEQLHAVDTARGVVDGVLERLGDLRTQLGGVESALAGVGRRMRGEAVNAVEYVDQVQSWLGDEFSRWFNTDHIRHELLPAAEGDVVVDVAAREVLWTEGKAPRSRPLEAFSSGEQAFAYTRARLGMLDAEEVRPLNRLIALDEFGAFIAQDRWAGLLAYLQERAKEHPDDQVLVILPLSKDYTELARSTVGPDGERLSALAAEITTRSYAVQVLEA
jgi:hypothetical protein